jgi:hypothetical protein
MRWRPALAVPTAAITYIFRRLMIARGSLVCIGATLLLAGCAGALKPPREQHVASKRGNEREFALQSAWRGQSYGTLVDTYGPPLYTMNIPGDRPNESVAVYGVRDSVSHCIDAFTVFHGSERGKIQNDSTVTSYFCR